jgi:hypothetical protein
MNCVDFRGLLYEFYIFQNILVKPPMQSPSSIYKNSMLVYYFEFIRLSLKVLQKYTIPVRHNAGPFLKFHLLS